MSKHDVDEMGTAGYFLPEDSQFRLRKLQEYMMFLSQLAQPRSSEEEDPWGPRPDIRTADLEICLELLAEQVQIVLDEVTWPAERVPRRTLASDPDAELAGESMEPETDEVRFMVTMEQIDALDRLADMLSANGDLVIAAEDAELANGTLAQLGQAIRDGARAVRGIVERINEQRLDASTQSPRHVGEERAVYGTPIAGRVPRRPVDPMFARLASPTWRQASQSLH